MDSKEFTEKVLEELWKIFSQRRGSIAATQRKLGVSESFFKDWKRGRSPVSLTKLVDALNFLGVDVADFFSRVTGPVSRGADFAGKPPKGVELFDARLRSEGIVLE